MSKDKNNPTAAELEILNILWLKQPLTVKEIHIELIKTKDVGYTTALKIMQNMTGKGLLKRILNGKSHLYTAAIKKEETQQNLLSKFVDTAFAGSASSLVMQLLGNKKTSKKELDEIKKIIDEMEQNQ
ncbi:MAG: BlaI/MecI/CopY family transcriptional regulator [Salinivirgaceae bacterium]|nr:BlaI/MecI/CopY family transcriptional regulator [Salinivirgaceae bacterium]